jgi:hypothetical protein
MPSGISGAVRMDSITTNATRSAAAPISSPTVRAEPHP